MNVAEAPRHFTTGEILRWRRVRGLVLAETRFEPGQRIHREQRAHARLLLVLKGALTETHGDTTTIHGTSTLLVRRPGEPKSYAASDRGATCLIVDIDPSWLERAHEGAHVFSQSRTFRRGLLLHLAHRLYGEFRLRDEVSRIAIESLVLGVIAEASRRIAKAAEPQHAPLWLQVALAIVEQQFTEPILIATVARRVGVHPVHLARTFRRVYRMPFASYVRQLRIDFARRQLAGSAALSEIAGAAGFCDQSHFCRCFKRYTGLTPAEYRATLR